MLDDRMHAIFLKNINRSMQNWFYYLFVCLIDITHDLVWKKSGLSRKGPNLHFKSKFTLDNFCPQ